MATADSCFFFAVFLKIGIAEFLVQLSVAHPLQGAAHIVKVLLNRLHTRANFHIEVVCLGVLFCDCKAFISRQCSHPRYRKTLVYFFEQGEFPDIYTFDTPIPVRIWNSKLSITVAELEAQ
ncbi:MAG: hypothetical protein IK130_02105 [Oscillospiraceae bacterium]|nr:hypothetical protein [Oscillospiraceae bacterium]